MTVTAKLLRLYLVDKQLRGLSSRLKAAERYLAEQDRLLAELDAKHQAVLSQARQLEATVKNDELEMSAFDTRMATLRDRMNNAKTSKEHSAFLTEISTIKADKKLIEDRALESIAKYEAMRKQLEEFEAQKEERQKLRSVASTDRDARAAEIKDRVAELETDRVKAKDDVPPSALKHYEERLALGVEEVMAPVEEQDRRNLEYTCAACYTHLPIEQVSILLRRGDLTKCPSCHAILYIASELRDDITAGQDKKKGSRKASASASAADEPF